jgi:hypothetical protein
MVLRVIIDSSPVGGFNVWLESLLVVTMLGFK